MQPNPVIDTAGFYDALAGTLIADRYELEKFIKVGGSSGVFEGSDRVMARRVAVKMMPSGDSTMELRFEREAQILSRLKHPNTLTVYDFGRTVQNGQTYLYMVMEYLDGLSLKELLRLEGALSPRRAVRIVSQICRSLHDAHRHGIVHRDVKPSNVFLVHCDDDPEFIKVLDFGVARLMNIREDPVDHDMTQAGRIIGTPRYMSPEQISSQPVEPRADVYSTGVMLYEMLTGRVPFEDSTLGGLLILHLKEAPPPFATRDFPFADEVPPALEQAVVRAMAKRPEERYSGIDELRVAVEAAVGLASPRKYADRRSSRPKRLDEINSDVVIVPPPVPEDADSEGILIFDSDDAEEEEVATRMIAPRAVARVRTPSQVVAARHLAPVPAPIEYAEDLEDALPVDADIPPSSRQSSRGRWMAAAIIVLLIGSVVVTFLQHEGDVPRVERLRAQKLQLATLDSGSLPLVRGPEHATPTEAIEPVEEPLELDEIAPLEEASPVEPVETPELVGEAMEPLAPEPEAESVVMAVEGEPFVPEPVHIEVASPEPEPLAVEPVAPLPVQVKEPVVPQPRPRPAQVAAPRVPKPKREAKPEPKVEQRVVVEPSPNREPARTSVPVIEQKKPETKAAVVRLVDEPVSAKPAQKEPETPRVAAPVVPLLD